MATTNQIPFHSMNPQGALEPGDAVGSCDEGMLGSQSKSYLFKEDILSMSIPCVLCGKAKHQKLSKKTSVNGQAKRCGSKPACQSCKTGHE